MKKILIIEDDEAVRCNTLELLKEEGYEVLEAINGYEGLELARKYLPDLILSDILMPVMDGYSVLQELQKDILTCSIPFIFFSARSGMSDIRHGMKIGADDYITKPYKINDLLDTINARLAKRNNLDRKFDELYNSIARSLPHELRTPLVSIMGFSDLIRNNSADMDKDEIIDMVNKINFAGNRLFNVIEKFLFYSELELINNDKQQLTNTKNSFMNSAGKATSVYAMLVADRFGRNNDLKLNLSDAVIKIPETFFRKLLEELVENAFKFSEKGTPVEISSFSTNDFYTIEIKDYGIGMTGEQIKEIGVLKQFDRHKFHQPGTGVGLTIARKIVELAGGSLSIESRLKEYTLIRLSLPLFNEGLLE
ncbi:MAG: response regulator [Ignavibacteriales bacterium]